jgi:hypothetical protein
MKKLKSLFLTVGLFIQGCSLETPLFKDGELPQSTEGVVVFNLYITDEHVKDGILFGGDPKYLYTNNNWGLENKVLKFTQYNHISTSGIKSKYIISRVEAGTYMLKNFSIVYSYSGGNFVNTITISSPQYTNKYHPLTFSVRPGEVKYLGDIEIQKSTTSGKGFQPIFKIHNRFADAKKFMDQKYPSLSEKLSESLMQKTQGQVLIEKLYSSVDTSDVLKDVEDAK